jgi:hypothetical protein
MSKCRNALSAKQNGLGGTTRTIAKRSPKEEDEIQSAENIGRNSINEADAQEPKYQ